MSRVSPARKAAFSILQKLEQGKGHSDELLRGQEVSALSTADRNLTTTLVLGVLRWQLALDQQIQAHLKKPNAKLDKEVRISLRLGAFQILHLDRIPARAAIDESVELTKAAGHRFASGMVNAVLRKLAAARAEAKSAPNETDAYPPWLVGRWTQQFGDDTACAICRAGQHPAPLALRLIDPNAESELVRAGIQLEPGELLTHARTVLTGDLTATAAFQEGRIRIQDEGSQLIAEIAGQGSAILDCCAAPGGKTMILAERNRSAHIVACETSEPRLRAMCERLKPFGNRIEIHHADATQLQYQAQFDLVLADVPCSGTGTLGRNPEIRHRLRTEDFARQAERQREILTRAIHAAKPGGRIVYSTCSLEREEDEEVVAAALAKGQTAGIMSMADRLRAMESGQILNPGAAERLISSLTPEGCLRLIPGEFGTDGFFVALLERIR
jgi:16S rRNA (cytosine967-C5)-methyltransferase